MKTFGECGDGPGKFKALQGLWLGNNKVYVGESFYESVIMIYDLEGNFLSEFPYNGIGFGNLCTDEQGNIYLFGTDHHHIYKNILLLEHL